MNATRPDAGWRNRAPKGFAALLAMSTLLAGPTSGWALLRNQDFLVEEWHEKEGLPAKTIRAIAQTPDRFLWLGTPEGLVRFDGVEFVLTGATHRTAAPEQEITALHVDRAGVLWAGTRDGKIERLAQARGDRELLPIGSVGEEVQKIVEDREGTLWLSLRGGGVASVRPTKSGHVLTTNASPEWRIAELMVDRQGGAWGLSKGRICTVRDGAWQPASPETPKPGRNLGLTCPARAGLMFTLWGNWWSAQGLHIYQVDGELTESLWGEGPPTMRSPRFRPLAMMEDTTGHLWLGTAGSGVFCSSTNGMWECVGTASRLGHSRVHCLFEDSEGSMWIGTDGNGLYSIRLRPITAEALPAPERNHLIRSLCASRTGGVWVGTDGAGLLRYEGGKFDLVGTGTDYTNLFVGAVLEDRQTNVWIGSAGGFWQLRAGQVEEIGMEGGPLRNTQFLFEDKAGTLWVGNRGRLMRRVGATWENVRLDAEGLIGDFRSVADGPNGGVWIGCGTNGLYLIRKDGIQVVGVEQEPALAQMRALYSDRENNLWIGTSGAGLLCYAKGKFTRWTAREGLPSDQIAGIIEDAEEVLWLSSDNGIFGCAKKQLEDCAAGRTSRLLCRQFSMADGLTDPDCTGFGQPALSQGADRRIWFCNMRALGSFQPAQPGVELPPVPVFTEEVRADGKVFRASGPRIPANTRRLEFHFTAPQLANPKQLCFRYRLMGMDRDWLDAGNGRVASYSQLPPGKYEFRVMVGSSPDGWRESARAFGLEIVPLWWQRTWFRGAALAGIIAGIVGLAVLNERRKLRRKLERLEAQHALEKERRRIARDLHDDLGSRLTEIFLTGELAKRGEQNLPELQQQLGNMTSKVRSLVTAMEEVVWTVNPRNDSLPNLAAFLCDFLERFLSTTSIRLRLDVKDPLPDVPLSAQTRHNVLLAFKEAANNVLKYSEATEVGLSIAAELGRLTIVLEDNGIGFDPANPPKSSSGNGLRNLHSRLEDLGGQTEINSRPGGGTSVMFQLPLAVMQPTAARPG